MREEVLGDQGEIGKRGWESVHMYMKNHLYKHYK